MDIQEELMDQISKKIDLVEDIKMPNLFPRNQWYVCALSKELSTEKPLARMILNTNLVLFRHHNGQAVALEDRCCHRALALSCGTIEDGGIRCGYHGLLYNETGKCIEIPGQEKIPNKAKVKAYPIQERNKIIWFWYGSEEYPTPNCEPPEYTIHDDARYVYDGDVYHYDAPYQLIHDNLMDLSHLGYVHLKTIGGNANVHMNAEMKVEQEGNIVKVVRYMPASEPPPTYKMAYPFKDKVDRWQEIEFKVSHITIWTGAVDANTDKLDDPQRQGFHMRGFHGITPETETTSHYFWTIATNPRDPEKADELKATVVQQTKDTFDEDRVVINEQYQNMLKIPNQNMVDIHVDVAANRARRIIKDLLQAS